MHAVPEDVPGGEGKQWKGRRFQATDLGGSAPTTLIAHRCGVLLESTTKIAGAQHQTRLTEWSGEFDWPILW
ncbi:MAG TPA: hypothetical protein VNZ52_05020 [Candidatus Thermoplasmatota archaeon]|nr:hypothetical protein [Candidatus Thermoplasmatota archaeon]